MTKFAIKWEYKFAEHLGEPEMNELGEEGWELVYHNDNGKSIFKRMLSDED